MKKRIAFSLLLALLLTLAFSAPAATARAEASDVPGAVYDEAGLLTAAQRSELEARAEDVAERYGCGVYIVILNDYRDYSSQASLFSFSQDYYRSRGLGAGTTGSGVLLLMSMQNRDYSLVTSGALAHEAFTDYAQGVLAAAFLDDFRRNDWGGGFTDYVDCCEELLARAAAGNPLDVEERESAGLPTGLKVGIIVCVPLLIAFAVCEGLRRQMKPVRRSTRADEYIVPGGVELSVKRDVFLNRSVTRTVVRTENRGPSGGHGMGGTTVNAGGFSGHSGKF